MIVTEKRFARGLENIESYPAHDCSENNGKSKRTNYDMNVVPSNHIDHPLNQQVTIGS